MPTYKVFENYQTAVLAGMENSIEEYKKFLIHKNYKYLLDLGLQIEAYKFGVLMQARKIFPQKEGGAASIISIVKKNPDYPKKEVEKQEQAIRAAYKSSIQPKDDKLGINEKVLRLNLNSRLMHVRPQYDYHEEGTPDTLYESFHEDFLPRRFKIFCSNQANLVLEKFGLKKDLVPKIVKIAFEEIVSIVNQNGKKYLSSTEINLVLYLEKCISKLYPELLKDLDLKSERIEDLFTLRKKSNEKYNTCCCQCGKMIWRFDKVSFCTRKENRSCYEKSLREKGKVKILKATLDAPEKFFICEKCKKTAIEKFTHKMKNIQRKFCSSRCYEAFRKKSQREKGKPF